MIYNLNINQKAIVDNGWSMDIYHAVVFDAMHKIFTTFPKVQKLNEEGIEWIWVDYKLILSQLPMIKYKSDWLRKVINDLSKFGLIEINPNNQVLNRTYFRLGKRAYLMFSSGVGQSSTPTDSHQEGYGQPSRPPMDSHQDDNNNSIIKKNNNISDSFKIYKNTDYSKQNYIIVQYGIENKEIVAESDFIEYLKETHSEKYYALQRNYTEARIKAIVKPFFLKYCVDTMQDGERQLFNAIKWCLSNPEKLKELTQNNVQTSVAVRTVDLVEEDTEEEKKRREEVRRKNFEAMNIKPN